MDEDDGSSSEKNYPLWFCAECAGTAIILFIGCMGCLLETAIPWKYLKVGGNYGDITAIHLKGMIAIVPAFTFGTAVLMSVQVFGPMSGGHFNPAISLGVLILGKIGFIKFFVYIIAQHIGSFIGFGILYAILPQHHSDNICNLHLNAEIMSVVKGTFIEFCATLILMLVIASLLDTRNKGLEDSVSIKVGLVFLGLVFAAFPFTGAALNPARSLSPAVFHRFYNDHWVFHLGPYAGGACGGVIYRFIFDEEEKYSLTKVINKLFKH